MLLSNTLIAALAAVASASFENLPRPRLAALTPLYPNSTSNADHPGPTNMAHPTLGTAATTAVNSTYTPTKRIIITVTEYPNITRKPSLKKMPAINKNTTAALTLGQTTTVLMAPMCPWIWSRCDEWCVKSGYTEGTCPRLYTAASKKLDQKFMKKHIFWNYASDCVCEKTNRKRPH